MKWLVFAVQNVLRNQRRSFVTVLIVAIGAQALMISGGFALYTYDQLAKLTASEIGHVVIAHQRYFDDFEEKPLEFGLDGYASLSERAGLLPGNSVKYGVPRLQFSGLVSTGEKSAVMLGIGVDPRHEFAVSSPVVKLEQGELLQPGSGAPADIPGILIGKDLARQLNARVGMGLTLLATTTEGSLNGVDVEVKGIIGTGKPDFDAHRVIVSLRVAQDLLQTTKVSTLSLYLDRLDQAENVKAELAPGLPGIALRIWLELGDYYRKVKALYNRIFGVLGIMIVMMVFFAIGNTLSMIVVERTREIGTLRALGTSPGRIVMNFVIEAVVIALAGALLGIGLSAIEGLALDMAGLMMPPPPGMTEGYPLRVEFSLPLAGITLITLTAAAVLAAWIAARRGANLSIVEALAHV